MCNEAWRTVLLGQPTCREGSNGITHLPRTARSWKLSPQWHLWNHHCGMEHRAWANWKWVGKGGERVLQSTVMLMNQALRRDALRTHIPPALECHAQAMMFPAQTLVLWSEELWSIRCRALLASGERTSCFQGPQKVYAAFWGSSISNRILIYFCLPASCFRLLLSSPMSIPHTSGTQEAYPYSTCLSCACGSREFGVKDIMCEAMLGNAMCDPLCTGTSFLGG